MNKPGQSRISKVSYSPSHSRAGTYEAEKQRYSNGESRSHHCLVEGTVNPKG
jgi:hypothetical protein